MTQTPLATTTTTPNPNYIAVDPMARPPKPQGDKARIEAAKDVKTLLNGGGTVEKGKYGVVGDKTQLGDTSKKGETTTFVKRSIAERIKDMQNDFKNLCGKGGDGSDTFKSYASTVKRQIAGLKTALEKLAEKSGGNYTTAEQELVTASENQIKTAESEIKRLEKLDREGKPANSGTPNSGKCDDQTVKKLATSPAPQKSDAPTENKRLKQVIDGIPGLSQDQKDAVGKTLNGIQKVVDKGQDYWNKQGKQQVIDTLTTVAKLPLILAVTIVAGIAAMFGLESPLKVEAGSTDKIASTTGNNTANTSQTPVIPSSTALTGTITGGISQTARTSTSTALTGITAGSSPTALTGTVAGSSPTALTGTVAGSSPTALTGTVTGGETQQPSQLQQGMALS